MTTPSLQIWLIPIFASSNSFPRDVGEKDKKNETVWKSLNFPKTFPVTLVASVSQSHVAQTLLTRRKYQ